MPQFNAYPALQARTFDLPAIMQQAEQLKGARTMNRLREMQMQQAQGEVQRQGQLRGLMPGVGEEAGLGPSAQQVLGIDPGMLGELMKIPKAQRDQAKAEIERIGSLLQAVETAPSVQRPQMYAMARQQYAASGADLSGIPETYDPAWVQTKLAETGKLMAVLEQAEKAAPSGYRSTEGGLEFTPGGPADPAQAGRLAAAKQEPGDDDPFGKGMEGQAYNALLEYKAYVDAGQTPPPGLVNRARVAQHTLSKRRFFRDPEGNLLSYTPGIPEGFPTPGQKQSQAAQPGQEGVPSPMGGLRTEIEAKPKVDVSLPVATIRKISELLNEGGETITGIVGTAKRLGGGLARQAGIPVSARAERLQRLLETLQGQMGPIILNEKRLSETERARLERIVGNVTPTMDEQALREALADLVDFIVSVEAR